MSTTQEPQPTLSEPAAQVLDAPDRLTMLRLLTMVTGVAVGIFLFYPRPESTAQAQPLDWLSFCFATLAGATLVESLFVARRLYAPHRLGVGGYVTLTLGIGIWLLLPVAVVERLTTGEQAVSAWFMPCRSARCGCLSPR